MPLSFANQAIKSFGRGKSSDQGQFSPIKILDHGHKCFCGQYVSDYMYPLYGLGLASHLVDIS